MPGRKREAWRPEGFVAADPGTYGGLFDVLACVDAPPPVPFRLEGPLAIIECSGPFDHHSGGLFLSYDDFKARVAGALASECQGVLVSCDSLGGVVDGMLDTSREIRALIEASGKPLWWYVDANSCSAAFAQACAATKIGVPETGKVGSIGAFGGVVDRTARDAAMGERWAIVTSGSYKALGNEHTPLSEAAVAEAQAYVDAVAQSFVGWVSERRGIKPEALEGLGGKTLLGREAVAFGLADVVVTFDELRAMMLAELGATNQAQAGGGQAMDEKEKARAALKALADAGDASAARALKAFDEEPEHKEPDKDDEEKAKAAAAAAAAEPPGKGEPDKDDEEKAKASAGLGRFEARLNNVERAQETNARQALYARHEGVITPALRKSLDVVSVAQAQTILESLPPQPKPLAAAHAARAALEVAPVQGEGTASGEQEFGMREDRRFRAVDERVLGLGKQEKPLVEMRGLQLVMNPGTPEQARKAAALMNEGKAAFEWQR